MTVKVLLYLSIWLSSFAALVPSCHSSTNLALNRPYTLSLPPNYGLAAPPQDLTSLTDGKLTQGRFWTQRSTVGWQKARKVELLIDLQKESNIAAITFSTARGSDADVHYPAHVAAFAGPDPERLQYLGDLADDADNRPGSYQRKKFSIGGLGVRGRYVFLVLVPKGHYLFCDEVEVLEGETAKGGPGSLSLVQARELAHGLERTGIDKELLKKLAENLERVPGFADSEGELAQIKAKIGSPGTHQDAAAVEDRLFLLRGALLKGRHPASALLVQNISQWAVFDPMAFPSASARTMSFLLPQGGYDAAAFAVTNLSAEPKSISVSLDASPPQAAMELYQVPLVRSAAVEYVADPLVPATGSTVLRPGESRMFFVTCYGRKPGKWNCRLRVTNGTAVISLPVEGEVVKVKLPEALSLNSVSWGYLDFALLQGRKQQAVADQFAHHTNVVVVPPKYLPLADQAQSSDFSALSQYLRMSGGASKVLLFAALGTGSRASVHDRYPFMGSQWKSWFKGWYREVTQAAAKAGIPQSSLYFYPYDEMDGKRADDFLSFASWVRQEVPGIQLYATLNNKDALKCLPHLDVAQVEDRDHLLQQLDAVTGSLWIYDTKGPAKSLSPYGYYRLMAWKAYLNGYRGIGFWSYGDAGWGERSGTAWDDFDGGYPDYAVVYEGENGTIVSSRRWEAWRMGIEDYELLTMYAKAKGEAAAQRLARQVLAAPADTVQADIARRQMLQELAR